MKITLFTANQNRHNYLVNLLSNNSDELFVVQENRTIFPGIVPGHYPASEIMKKYFKKVAKIKGDKKFSKIYDIVEKVMIKKKNIHPNVDYPTGPTYHLMGFDTDFFTPIFVISRITGWSAHIMEQHAANKLIRPLASYKGNKHRKVMQLNQR